MSASEFLLLINALLIGFYLFAIARFFYAKSKYKKAFDDLKFYPELMYKEWAKYQEAVSTFCILHVIAVGFYLKEVPVVLMIIIGVAVYLDVYREAAMLAQKLQLEKESTARTRPSDRSAPHGAGDFDFDEHAWTGQEERQRSSRPNSGASSQSGEPDYASALRDAQAEANKVSDAKAEKFARLWRKLSKEAGLHQKTRLFRELVAMLLEERAKGFKGRPDNSDPTEQEVTRARLAAPRRG